MRKIFLILLVVFSLFNISYSNTRRPTTIINTGSSINLTDGSITSIVVSENISIITSLFVSSNTVGTGAVLYQNNDGLCVADADSVLNMPGLFLALESGTGTKNVLMFGFYTDSSYNFNVGETIYVSTNAGIATNIIPSGSGDQIQEIGRAVKSNRIFFNPSSTLLELQ